jgi:hypothetical protein
VNGLATGSVALRATNASVTANLTIRWESLDFAAWLQHVNLPGWP